MDSTATGLTARLGTFIAGLAPGDVPGEAFPLVRRGIADTIGVLHAGRQEPVVTQALALVPPLGPASCQLLGDQGMASAADAAFVNATAGHALDYDDTGLDGHPSVVLGPVVLAGAEQWDLNWRQALTAYVAGYEVWAELISRDADKHHGKGWHPTAVFGAVASAAAAAHMRRLGPAKAAHALGIAASMASGLVANFGSMTKPLQVGWAARNGLLAAQMAAAGVTASPDVLESPRGFLAALSPTGQVRLDGEVQAGKAWQILRQGLSIKRYPVCYATHRAIDAALSWGNEVAQNPEAVSEVVVQLGHLQAAMLRSDRPTTSLDAKFSIQFVLACALLRGRVGLADLTPERVQDPAIQALLRRVRIDRIQDQDPLDPLFSPADQVRVRFVDGGERQSLPVHRANGHASHPLSDAELFAKFSDCAAPALGPSRAAALWQHLMGSSLDAPAHARLA